MINEKQEVYLAKYDEREELVDIFGGFHKKEDIYMVIREGYVEISREEYDRINNDPVMQEKLMQNLEVKLN